MFIDQESIIKAEIQTSIEENMGRLGKTEASLIIEQRREAGKEENRGRKQEGRIKERNKGGNEGGRERKKLCINKLSYWSHNSSGPDFFN